MKQKFHYLFMLLLMIIVGAGGVKAEETTIGYIFVSKKWNAKIIDTNPQETANWTSGKDGAHLTSGQGVQITADLSGANGTSPKAYDNISRIVVKYCTNKSSGVGEIIVKIGDGTERSFSVTKPQNSNGQTLKEAVFDYDNPESGKVKVTGKCTTNSVYIHSVYITYNDGPSLPPADLAFAEGSYTVTIGETFTAPTLTNPYNLTVTYASSNTDVATVDANTGTVTLVGAGSTTITASFAGNDTYAAGSASYTLTVSKAPLVVKPKNVKSNYFVKVTDVAELEDGDAILIVNEDAKKAMSTTQNKNNRGECEVKISNFVIETTENDGTQHLILVEEDGKFYFNTGDREYLYAVSSSDNYLRTGNDCDNNYKAAISIKDGNASIIFQGSNTHNTLRYNSTNKLFSCYASGQQDVQIYKEVPVVAAIGTKKYETLQAAFAAAEAGETVTLLKDVDATAAMYSGDTRYNLWINNSITVDGTKNKYSITVKGRGIGVQGASDKIDVTFKNTTVKNVGDVDGRCIDTRGNLNSLTLENATLTTAESEFTGYLQPLTIGGNQKEEATVTIKDSELITVEAANKGYAITTFNPVNMTIDGSTLKGWACLNLKAEDSSEGSHGSNISVTNSTLVSANGTPGETNAYCLIKIEDDDVNVTVSGSTININGADNSQSIVSFIKKDNQTLTSNCNVSLCEGNEVTLDNNFDFAVNESETSKLVISGGTFNVPVPEENCAEGMIPTTLEDGKFSVKVGQYLAQVGEQKFETFAEAVAALTEENNTITLLANVADAYTLTEGQTLNVIRGEYTLTVLAPDGNILQTAEADGVTTYSYAAPVAKIGDTMYASLAAAVAAVPADGPETTITMLADASSDQITIPADKNIVIDFAGCTVTPTGKWLIINNGALTLNNTTESAGGITSTFKGLVDNYGTLAVNSGTYSTTAEIAFWNNNENSTITVNSGSVSSSANVIVAENNSIVNVAGGTITATGEESYGIRSTSSKVNVSGGKVTAATEAIHLQESSTATISGDAVVEVTGEETWGIVVLSNSTLTVKDNATITSSGFAISGNGSEGQGGTTVNIEGGIVTGGSAGIYQPQSGNLNITGGTISGETGVYVKSGELNVTGGAINGTGEKVDYTYSGNGVNPTGDALVIDNCGYPGGAPTASISGGTFTSTNAAAVASYAATDHTAIDKFVSGGTFSSAVPAEFCEEGYIPADLGDGKYGVKLYISAPIVFHDSGEYEGELKVAIAGENVKYTLNGGEAQTYTDPINITAKTTIKAWTELDGATSDVVTREYKIVETEKPAINLNGYYRIKGGDGNYVNVAGRKTVTFVDKAATATAAGTVIKVETENAQVKVLRSQGVDVPGYADKAMRYVPKIVQLVAEKLGAVGEGNLLGKDGLDAIMKKFNESFDYHLYLEEAGDGYRIYGRTPSMKPVVDFYAENKANVDAKLPQLEQFINDAIQKVLTKTNGSGSSILVPFKLETVWQNMDGTLTEPVDEASTARFYEEVLSSETNVWNFAYETAMIYWTKLKNHKKFEEYRDKLGEYAKYIDKVENIRPNFKYYIVQKGGEMDIISEGNGDIVANSANTIWTLEDRTEFSVAFNEDNMLNNKYYTTLYTDFAYTLPEGVKAYKVTGIDESGCFGHAATEEIGSQSIAAQTPVLLVSETSGNQTLALAETGTAVEGNWLVGPDYLINKYNIKTAQVESLFDMAKSIMGEDFYNQYVKEYEHLMLRTAGTVNNKYFFGLSKDDCKNLEEYVCMLDNTEEAGLAFANGWETMGVNKAFLTSDIYTEIRLAQVGDVDRSGDVTIADVKALVEIVLGKVTPETNTEKKYDFGATDVNFDCKTTIADVTALVNIILGKTQN